MEAISYNPLVVVTDEELQTIRTCFEVGDEKNIQESLDAVLEWCKKESHLSEASKYMHRNILERLLLLSKGSVEVTKTKVDRMITTRGMFPELLQNRTYEEFGKLFGRIKIVPLKKLNPSNQARCVIFKINYDNFGDNTVLEILRCVFMVGELRICYEYTVSDIYILDMKDISISILPKLNPILFKKAEVLCTEAHACKIKGLYLLNAPPFVDKFISLIKPFLKEKVASRLRVISSYEDLHKYVSKEILPEDFGGTESSLAEQWEQWKDFMQTDEGGKAIIKWSKIISDESKRSSYKFNEEYLGMPGSFKRMTVD